MLYAILQIGLLSGVLDCTDRIFKPLELKRYFFLPYSRFQQFLANVVEMIRCSSDDSLLHLKASEQDLYRLSSIQRNSQILAKASQFVKKILEGLTIRGIGLAEGIGRNSKQN